MLSLQQQYIIDDTRNLSEHGSVMIDCVLRSIEKPLLKFFFFAVVTFGFYTVRCSGRPLVAFLGNCRTAEDFRSIRLLAYLVIKNRDAQMDFRSWHRSISVYLQAILAAGFQLQLPTSPNLALTRFISGPLRAPSFFPDHRFSPDQSPQRQLLTMRAAL